MKLDLGAANVARAQAAEGERRSLRYFEPRRKAIAALCAKKLNIPKKEFDEPAEFFHYFTTVIAVADWVVETGRKVSMERNGEEDYEPLRDFAWMKVVSSAIARLAFHQMAATLQDHPESISFVEAFLKATLPDGSTQASSDRRFAVVQTLLSARELCRTTMIRALTGYWDDGAPGGLVQTDFDGIEEALDQWDPDHEDTNVYPRRADMDACAMLYFEITQLIEANDSLPMPIPATMPGHTDSGAFKAAKIFISQFALLREPKDVTLHGVSDGRAFEEVAKHVAGAGPEIKIWIESARGGPEPLLPVLLDFEGRMKRPAHFLSKQAVSGGLGVRMLTIPIG